MNQMIRGERIHYFKATHPAKIFTAFYEKPRGRLRAEIRVQTDSGELIHRVVHVDQIEKPRAEREMRL